MLRLGRELQESYQQKQRVGRKACFPRRPACDRVPWRSEGCTAAKGAQLFPLQSRASDLAGGKGLVGTVHFKGYSDLHCGTSHSAGPAEAWAVGPAGSVSQGQEF